MDYLRDRIKRWGQLVALSGEHGGVDIFLRIDGTYHVHEDNDLFNVDEILRWHADQIEEWMSRTE